jgi:hypothetical protein
MLAGRIQGYSCRTVVINGETGASVANIISVLCHHGNVIWSIVKVEHCKKVLSFGLETVIFLFWKNEDYIQSFLPKKKSSSRITCFLNPSGCQVVSQLVLQFNPFLMQTIFYAILHTKPCGKWFFYIILPYINHTLRHRVWDPCMWVPYMWIPNTPYILVYDWCRVIWCRNNTSQTLKFIQPIWLGHFARCLKIESSQGETRTYIRVI